MMAGFMSWAPAYMQLVGLSSLKKVAGWLPCSDVDRVPPSAMERLALTGASARLR